MIALTMIAVAAWSVLVTRSVKDHRRNAKRDRERQEVETYLRKWYAANSQSGLDTTDAISSEQTYRNHATTPNTK